MDGLAHTAHFERRSCVASLQEWLKAVRADAGTTLRSKRLCGNQISKKGSAALDLSCDGAISVQRRAPTSPDRQGWAHRGQLALNAAGFVRRSPVENT